MHGKNMATFSKQFVTGCVFGAAFMLLCLAALNLGTNTNNTDPILTSSNSRISASSVTTTPSTKADDDKKKEYCARHYNPEIWFHKALQALYIHKRSILYLDIGGHEGTASFPALICASIAHRVITVEPVARNQDRLVSIGASFGVSEPSFQWRLIRGAFSNETGTTTIYVPSDREDNAALDRGTSTINVGGEAKEEEVKLFKGDDVLVSAQLKPDVIKIDVQGVELKVMQGLDKVLSEERSMTVVAEHDCKLTTNNGFDLKQPYEFMIQRGFKAYCAPKLTLDERKKGGVVTASEKDKALTLKDIEKGMDVSVCEDLTYIKVV